MNEIEEDYNKQMIEAFIAKPEKTLWYQNAFSKFNVNGVDNIRWHWSWWAFFGGAAFLLYRKQYIPALVLFIASLLLNAIPIVSLIFSILAGGYSTYFIYKGYKNKLSEIESNISNKEMRISTMQQIGGYHSWVAWVYIVLVGFGLLGIISALV